LGQKVLDSTEDTRFKNYQTSNYNTYLEWALYTLRKDQVEKK